MQVAKIALSFSLFKAVSLFPRTVAAGSLMPCMHLCRQPSSKVPSRTTALQDQVDNVFSYKIASDNRADDIGP